MDLVLTTHNEAFEVVGFKLLLTGFVGKNSASSWPNGRAIMCKSKHYVYVILYGYKVPPPFRP